MDDIEMREAQLVLATLERQWDGDVLAHAYEWPSLRMARLHCATCRNKTPKSCARNPTLFGRFDHARLRGTGEGGL